MNVSKNYTNYSATTKKKNLQKDNIIAAKAWHARFPPDEIVLAVMVSFQNGRKVAEEEIRAEDGVVWDEVGIFL